MEKYGLTEKQLAKVAVKNFTHARRNPLAQMRDAMLSVEQAATVSEKNPRFAPPAQNHRLFADHRRRSGVDFVLRTICLKNWLRTEGDSTAWLRSHNGLFAVGEKGCPGILDCTAGRRKGLFDVRSEAIGVCTVRKCMIVFPSQKLSLTKFLVLLKMARRAIA